LARKPAHRFILIELAQEAGYTEKICGGAMHELLKAKMAERISQRGGAAITQKGIDYLSTSG
jgi:hypothetical protein